MSKGTKIFIIHGWAYSVEPWGDTIKALKKQGYSPHMLHVPGLTAPSKKSWTIDDYVEWLHGELAGEKDIRVIGHSNGGRIALNFDVKYPGIIDQLVLISTAGPIRFRVKAKRLALNTLATVFGPLKKVPFLRKVVRKLTGAGDYAAAPTNMQVTLNNVLTSDANLSLRRTTAPLSLVWGSKDTVTPLWMAENICEARPGTRLQKIIGAGHAPYKTHAQELADALNSALSVGSK